MSKVSRREYAQIFRELYTDQLSDGRGLTSYMNKRRKPFTNLNPSEADNFAYRSTSDYLRQNFPHTLSSSDIILSRNMPRTKTASELMPRSPRNRSISGNPKYKAQEDYYDEIQLLKIEMKTVEHENNTLRARVRRLEEDNTRKRKEIEALYDMHTDDDLRGTLLGSSTDRKNNASNANVVLRLKQRIFKLESQLREREEAISEIKSNPKWTKSTELEIRNRALIGELDRLQYIEKNDYITVVEEEGKNTVRRLNKEVDELKQENESLQKEIQELKRQARENEEASGNRENNLLTETREYKQKYQKITDELKDVEDQREQFRKNYEHANQELEETNRENARLKKELEESRNFVLKYESSSRENGQYDAGKVDHETFDKQHRRTSASMKLYKQSDRWTDDEDDNPDNRPVSNRSSMDDNSNHSLKTVQASLRGYLNRTEVEKNQSDVDPSHSRPQTPSSKKTINYIVNNNDDSDDNRPTVLSSRLTGSLHSRTSNKNKPYSPHHEPELYSRRSLLTDNARSSPLSSSNVRNSLSKRSGSPSPLTASRQSSSQLVNGASGFEPISPKNPKNLDSSNQSSTSDRDPISKSQRLRSPANTSRPLSPVNVDRRSPSIKSPLPSQKSPSMAREPVKDPANDDDDNDVMFGD